MSAVRIHGKRYSLEEPTEKASAALDLLKFVDAKMEELNNMQALLTRAKIGYVDSLKQELLYNKAGLNFDL